MAVTLTIKNSAISGPAVFKSGNMTIAADQQSVSFGVINNLGTQISDSKVYLSTLNQVQPNVSGNMQILGDYCTSIVQTFTAQQQSATLKLSKSSVQQVNLGNIADQGAVVRLGQWNPGVLGQGKIQLFDGCKACNDCKGYWQVRDALLTSMYWAIGMKNAQLYHQNAAACLWDKMTKDLWTNNYLVSKSDSSECSKQGSKLLEDNYRLTEIGKATKMLYQYKALVAMWNYIVHMQQGVMQVIEATQSYSGFVVQVKRHLDLCAATSTVVELHFRIEQTDKQKILDTKKGYIYASVVNANTGVYIGDTAYKTVTTNTTTTTTTPSTPTTPQTSDSVSILIPFNNGFVTNTESTTSTPSTQSTTTSTVVTTTKSPDISVYDFQHKVELDVSKTGNGFPIITGTYTFTINSNYKCKLDVSGALKVLPVIKAPGASASQALTLKEYITAALNATDISTDDQQKTVRWTIDTWWKYSAAGNSYSDSNTGQTMFFTTGYNLSPP